MDIYRIGSGEILAIVQDGDAQKARRFVISDIPGYPDNIPAATAYVEAQTLSEPENLALHLPNIGPNPPIILPHSNNLSEEIASEVERVDFTNLGYQVAAELAYLDTTISVIDGYAASQIRDVVKRLCQEQRAILLALRFIIRKLS